MLYISDILKIGIIGCGFVGEASKTLTRKEIEILVYDINQAKCSLGVNEIKNLLDCKLIFISVPTPINKDGSCYITIVENVCKELKAIDYKNFIVFRSTDGLADEPAKRHTDGLTNKPAAKRQAGGLTDEL